MNTIRIRTTTLYKVPFLPLVSSGVSQKSQVAQKGLPHRVHAKVTPNTFKAKCEYSFIFVTWTFCPGLWSYCHSVSLLRQCSA